jgi:hypothetical protein
MEGNVTSSGALGLEDIDLEPTLEELDVPIGSVSRGRSRSVPVVLGVLGALVGWGFMGGTSHTPGSEAGTPSAAGASPVMTGPIATSRPPVRVALTAPVEGTLLPGEAVSVTGAAPSDSGPLTVTVALGAVILGEAVVEPIGGVFSTTVPVIAPRHSAPLPVSIRVALAAEPGSNLAERAVRLSAARAVTIDDAERTPHDGTEAIEVRGSAALDVGKVTVVVIGDGKRSTVEALVTPVRDPRLAGAARLLGVGQWTATIPAAGKAGGVRIVVRWVDGTPAGGVASLELR